MSQIQPATIVSVIALGVSIASFIVAARTSDHSRRAKNLDLKAELDRRINRLSDSLDSAVVKGRDLKQLARTTSDFELYENVHAIDDEDLVKRAREVGDRIRAVPPSGAMAVLESLSEDIDRVQRRVDAMHVRLDELKAKHAIKTEKAGA